MRFLWVGLLSLVLVGVVVTSVSFRVLDVRILILIRISSMLSFHMVVLICWHLFSTIVGHGLFCVHIWIAFIGIMHSMVFGVRVVWFLIVIWSGWSFVPIHVGIWLMVTIHLRRLLALVHWLFMALIGCHLRMFMLLGWVSVHLVMWRVSMHLLGSVGRRIYSIHSWLLLMMHRGLLFLGIVLSFHLSPFAETGWFTLFWWVQADWSWWVA
mmetsp:Transcript_18382/g.39730  ORF Transcript_18382/g.39730 Transcript_18382/m.39730 type:complete len:211 (-) Transcript_18382:408-1040(-)